MSGFGRSGGGYGGGGGGGNTVDMFVPAGDCGKIIGTLFILLRNRTTCESRVWPQTSDFHVILNAFYVWKFH
jgi:hypothetical protein